MYKGPIWCFSHDKSSGCNRSLLALKTIRAEVIKRRQKTGAAQKLESTPLNAQSEQSPNKKGRANLPNFNSKHIPSTPDPLRIAKLTGTHNTGGRRKGDSSRGRIAADMDRFTHNATSKERNCPPGKYYIYPHRIPRKMHYGDIFPPVKSANFQKRAE